MAVLLFRAEGPGCVVLLPAETQLDVVVVELLEELCRIVNSALMPYLEKTNWVHHQRYEISEILQMRSEIESIRNEAQKEIERLEDSIVQTKRKQEVWYRLLEGTGDKLVTGVINTLKVFGFSDVIDIDKKMETEGDTSSKREDVQILDSEVKLIVDIKGVQGHPSDADTGQSHKHAVMRMREWDSTKVQALTIINSQRHLPPHDRDVQAYRDELVKNAEDLQQGLMTTWDIWRLKRNFEKLKWKPEDVKPLFYRTGRIEPIPEHYAEIGQIAETLKPAMIITPNCSLKVGDVIAIYVDDEFDELPISSMQIDGNHVGVSKRDVEVGIAWNNGNKRYKKEMRVFLVRS